MKDSNKIAQDITYGCMWIIFIGVGLIFGAFVFRVILTILDVAL